MVYWARSELIGSANNLFCLFIFFGAKENERRVVYATPLQKGTRIIRRFTAGPLDFFVLFKAAGILKTQTPRASTLLRSNSLKSFIVIFSGAQQMSMGKHYNHAQLVGNQISEPARLLGLALWAWIFTGEADNVTGRAKGFPQWLSGRIDQVARIWQAL